MSKLNVCYKINNYHISKKSLYFLTSFSKLKRKISSRTLKSAFKYVSPKKAAKYKFLKQLFAVIISAVIFFFASNSRNPPSKYQKDTINYQPITTSAPIQDKKLRFKNTFDARLNSWKPVQPPASKSSIKKLDISSYKEPSLAEIDYTRPPDSMDFIFHNKLPKSGSSTMNGLLRQLARRNGFNYQKLEPVDLNGDRFDLEKPLMDYLKQHFRPPYFLLKHHFFFNMAKYNLSVIEPTYVNVIRDPLDWFVSHYYFERFGWARKKTDRNFKGSEEDLKRTVDECVMQRHFECLHPTHKYLEFICGTSTGWSF